MSVNSNKKVPEIFAEQLATLENQLQGHAHDDIMLAEVSVTMRSLLSGNGASENHIRRLLQKQFAVGHLRRETFELVQNLLGKIVTEELVRSPLPEGSSVADEIFTETAVIEDQLQVPSPAKAGADSQLQVGSVLRDRFLLKERVSEGSMGIVYKALDRRLAEAGDDDCYVAVKVLSPQLSRNGTALRALQQEAAKGRCLIHPNIVRFIDLDREDELYFIVMEWLDGRSLSSILDDKSGNSLDLETALDIVRQIARALDYAHQLGVIHADVKPGNVIITATGQVKLIDFGVARIRQKENEGKSRTGQGAIHTGTPAYSSMQVLTGEDPVPADDVFSLACLMYRLVAGYRVFGPRNAAQAAEDGMEPQQPKLLSDAQWQPLKKALSYSRVTRFESPTEFILSLNGKADKLPAAESESPANAPVAEVPDIRTVPKPVVKVRTKKDFVAPIRVEKEPIMYEPDDDEPRRSPWRFAVAAIIIVSSAAVVTQTDLIERIGEAVQTVNLSSITGTPNGEPETDAAPATDQAVQDVPARVAEEGDLPADIEIGPSPGNPTDDVPIDDEFLQDVLLAEDEETNPAGPETGSSAVNDSSVDFSTLPPATITVSLASESDEAAPFDLVVREDSSVAIVDFTRSDATETLTVLLSETDFSGNRSPLDSGRYSLQNDGVLWFAAGQDRARLTISMRSNPVREPDRQITLSVRDVLDAEVDLARIDLVLEDDDQRAFEERLPANTVAFAVNQVSVREFDPAAQIDVIRYKPDSTSLEVPFELLDVTASEGQDYFAPTLSVVYFGPGQRTARILIPLGQDGRPEADEAFMLRLNTEIDVPDADLFSQIAVMIRDDDS